MSIEIDGALAGLLAKIAGVGMAVGTIVAGHRSHGKKLKEHDRILRGEDGVLAVVTKTDCSKETSKCAAHIGLQLAEHKAEISKHTDLLSMHGEFLIKQSARIERVSEQVGDLADSMKKHLERDSNLSNQLAEVIKLMKKE